MVVNSLPILTLHWVCTCEDSSYCPEKVVVLLLVLCGVVSVLVGADLFSYLSPMLNVIKKAAWLLLASCEMNIVPPYITRILLHLYAVEIGMLFIRCYKGDITQKLCVPFQQILISTDWKPYIRNIWNRNERFVLGNGHLSSTPEIMQQKYVYRLCL